VTHALLDTIAESAATVQATVVVVGAGRPVQAPVLDMNDLLNAASSIAPESSTTADTPALLIYTSGTTGSPKGALHAHHALFGHLPGFELSHSYFPKPGDSFWTPADWAWIGALMDALLPTLFFGRPIVAWPSGSFDPELAIRVIVEGHVRNVFVPPTALRLMKAAGVALPSETLRTAVSGGEVLDATTLDWARHSLGVTVSEMYGQTEANYLVGNSPDLFRVRPGSMGRAYPGHEVGLLGEDGETVPIGETGEVALRTPDPVAFLRYWNAPEATAEKFAGRWLRTGDLAVKDGDGYLWFKGRADDQISSAGYRIAPVEVETCLLRHPAVAAVAVVGVPDPIRGAVVKAFVVPARAGEPPEADELRNFVRRRLAAYEYPREIEFVSELPLTVTGKIRRRDLVPASTDLTLATSHPVRQSHDAH
jgi:acetyl-CoA synthetase